MVNAVCPSRYKINRKQIRQTGEAILKKMDLPLDPQLNIIFVGRNKMKTIARTYKKENLALPVLSFGYNPQKDGLWGEIFICYPQAVLLAAERDKRVDAVINNLIEHGIENLLKS